jgi:hypothetical protein
MMIKLSGDIKKKLKGTFGKYSFEVGILEDGPHYQALRGEKGTGGLLAFKTYAGGPARKQTRKVDGTLGEISSEIRGRVNYLTKPFEKRSSDIIKFTNEFFRLALGKSEKRRAENLLQAVVRNPILRGDYGSNSELTQTIKGFDRLFIDTSQFFRAIKARCWVKHG